MNISQHLSFHSVFNTFTIDTLFIQKPYNFGEQLFVFFRKYYNENIKSKQPITTTEKARSSHFSLHFIIIIICFFWNPFFLLIFSLFVYKNKKPYYLFVNWFVLKCSKQCFFSWLSSSSKLIHINTYSTLFILFHSTSEFISECTQPSMNGQIFVVQCTTLQAATFVARVLIVWQ